MRDEEVVAKIDHGLRAIFAGWGRLRR